MKASSFIPLFICIGAIQAQAALTAPPGLSVIKDWNFDGDGTPGGSVDSGSSATDWTSNSWESVRDDGGFSNIQSEYQNNSNLYVSTSHNGNTGALIYDPNVLNSRSFELDLGDSMVKGFVDLNAYITQTADNGAGGDTVSSKISLFNGSTELFQLNIRKENQVRYVDSTGNQNISGVTTTSSNQYQLSWDNGQYGFFFENAGGTATELTGLSAIGSSSAAVTKIVFESGTTGARATTYIENITISGSAVPEPSSSALLGLAGLTLLTRRRR